MIRMDPLYLLLLVELACLLAGGVAYLAMQRKKFMLLYRNTLKEVVEANQARDELKKQLEDARGKTGAGPAASRTAPGNEEIEDLRKKLESAQAAVLEKTKTLELLQGKFSDLEKEYLVLYQQQQQGQQGQPQI
jgi:hypothetical protein